jgi:hypothetical protein
MAQIQIPGIGAVEVPDFATDYTLNQVLAALSSQEAAQLAELSDIAQGIGTERSILQAQLAEQRTTGSDVGASRRSQDRANKTSVMTLQQMKKQHKDLVKEASKQGSNLPKHTAQILRTAASMVGGKGIGDALSMMPGNLGQGIALATKVIGEFADSQRRLTDVGFGLGTSILSTTEAVSKFNLPLSEIERIAGTHAVTLDYLNEATIGAESSVRTWMEKGVKPGITVFAQLSNHVRGTMKEFGNYGFTVTEVNSYLAEYLESDRKRGISADLSTSNLTHRFGALANEVSAYAADTGRNRKDLMKAQLDNKNRTDASTYSMMLRAKGEDAAAETFEKNLTLITNEMKSRYGDNADSMIDAWIQAQAQGRGLEATAEGAEFMAMLGPAGAVLNKMALAGGAIDPAQFDLLDEKLKESVGAYDTHTYALLAKQKESLNIAANMIMHSRDTSVESRALWKEDVARKVAEGASADAAGAGLLKANEKMVEITTDLQQGIVKVVNSIAGEDSGLADEFKKATDSVGHFTKALGQAVKGDVGGAASTIKTMVEDNPFQLLIAGVAGVLPKLGALGTAAAYIATFFGVSKVMSVPGAQVSSMAANAAQANIKGQFSSGAGGISIGNDTYAEGQKFKHQGTEYRVVDGKPQVTKAGLASITGGVGGKAYRGMKGSTAGGLFSMGMAAYEGYGAYSNEKERFGNIKGASSGQKAEHEKILTQIIKNTLAKGGGGVIGGAAMGALMGMMTGNPFLAMLATGVGSYMGYEYGDDMTPVDVAGSSDFTKHMKKQAKTGSNLTTEEIRANYMASGEAKLKAANTDPTYLKLVEIKTLLEEANLHAKVGTTAQIETATSTKKNSTDALGRKTGR